MAAFRKKFDSPFVIDRSKLKRLVEVVEAKFRENGTPQFTFEPHLSDQKVIQTDSVDAVLALDNSKHNRIERLLLHCRDNAEQNKRVLHLDFEGRTGPAEINLLVRADNYAWAGETFRAAEDQVERTLATSFMNELSNSRALAVSLVLAAMILVIVLFAWAFVSGTAPSRLTNAMWLTDQDLKALEPLQSDPALAKEILARQIHNLTLAGKQRQGMFAWITRGRPIALITAVLFIFGAFVYLYLNCYPNAVFLWGDEESWYRSLEQKRKFIWGGILLAFSVSVLANLFVSAFSHT